MASVNGNLYELLVCPNCGASPKPDVEDCPGCDRSILASGGGIDLLADEFRAEAEVFSVQYRALRKAEGWIGPGGREDPDDGLPRLWMSHAKLVGEAVAIVANELTGGLRPVVADVGSGGGWAERLLPTAAVIAIDVLDVQCSSALTVRGDMRKLPLRDKSVDAALYAASLHYSHARDCIPEAARVLRPGGLLIAVDSPIYPNPRAQAEAVVRTATYYKKAGYPNLAAHYHPVEVGELRSVLGVSGFRIERLELGSGAGRLWRRLGMRPPSSLLLARKRQLRRPTEPQCPIRLTYSS